MKISYQRNAKLVTLDWIHPILYMQYIHVFFFLYVCVFFPSMPFISTVFPAGWKPDKCAPWTIGSGSFRSEYLFWKCHRVVWILAWLLFCCLWQWKVVSRNVNINSTSCFPFPQVWTLAVLLLTSLLTSSNIILTSFPFPPGWNSSYYFTPTSLFLVYCKYINKHNCWHTTGV